MDEVKNNEQENYGEYLHRYGLKNTRTRQLVLQLLVERHGVLTAEEIFQQLVVQGEAINFSTVYRILEMFTQKGLTEKNYLSSSRKYGFTLHSLGHRHHLVCLRCHRIIEVEHCPITDFEEQLATQTDFSIVGHNLEWYGYCPECRAQMKN